VTERLRLRGAALLVLLACLQLLLATGAAAVERSVIGRSVQGRPLVSVRTGSPRPTTRILVVGDIHGNERAGRRIASLLVALGAPQGAELLVVPTINPDGVAARTRGNAHGVDLNRNFPFDWRPLSGAEYAGPRPLSEPETRAIHRFILRTEPDVTIWFHQPFGLVDRPSGNPFVARRFSRLIGLPLVDLPGRYPGSASRWQNHRLPRSTAFVVELPSRVAEALVVRGVAAVYRLASELSSPGVEPAELPG
jgi:protein MpaA